MALPEGVNKRYASIAGIILVALWLWVAFDRPYSFSKHTTWSQYANVPTSTQEDTEKANNPESKPPTPDVFDEPEVDSDAIRNMCGGTQWNSSLVFRCDNSAGTVANVRNSILICVRHAIEVGANIILPRILNPDGDHEAGRSLLYWYTHPFDFMFDQDHFVNSLKRSCPDMSIYEKWEKVPFPPNNIRPPIITVHPEKIGQRDGENWHSAFKRLVSAMIRPDEDTFPIVIELARPAPIYDIFSDGAAFVGDFGSILQFRKDVRDLANKSLMKLSDIYNLSFDSEKPPQRFNFFGMHLLTEEEPLGCTEGWPCIDREYGLYAEETKGYLEQAQASNSSVIYVSSHRQDEISRLKADATPLGIQVYDKWSLLENVDDQNKLNGLTKDQKQLVDYLVLLKAAQFAGIGHSSFSWNVALKRHTMSEKSNFTIGSHIFQDSLSKLWGKIDSEKTLYHSMWP
ncbi:hypothetical protein BJ878DRAFT_2819 [Calycina marina]|uniref:O-fucosyltransferase family protein n=1 Tax=Calycina marina TaxID=1763456 RepID=A0A9P7ZC27_9HELO|nr:hypothetical protein BJ878DRAFT_2819 [Calycina marina]